MSASELERRIEAALQRAVGRTVTVSSEVAHGRPLVLEAALAHAVFPPGQRIRSKLALAVAAACGEDRPELSDAAAAAVELLHCASLAHDDMPCFDNAPTRRGRPSVHAAFGEAAALLAGDALIVLALETAAAAAAVDPARAAGLCAVLARAVGMPNGIVAGQGLELEPRAEIGAYQRAKTGALFAGAAQAGAVAAGHEPAPWGRMGLCLGGAHRVADDIGDATGRAAELGKPVGRDAALGRPNMVHALGLKPAARKLMALAEAAADAVPPCPGAAALKIQIRAQAAQFLPAEAARAA